MGEKKNAYKTLVGNPKEKRPLGRLSRRCEDNIKKDLRKIGWGGLDWIYLTQHGDHWRAFLDTVMNIQVP
jgi:hypothetical protein